MLGGILGTRRPTSTRVVLVDQRTQRASYQRERTMKTMITLVAMSLMGCAGVTPTPKANQQNKAQLEKLNLLANELVEAANESGAQANPRGQAILDRAVLIDDVMCVASINILTADTKELIGTLYFLVECEQGKPCEVRGFTGRTNPDFKMPKQGVNL